MRFGETAHLLSNLCRNANSDLRFVLHCGHATIMPPY
jgi:hypothetical protein